MNNVKDGVLGTTLRAREYAGHLWSEGDSTAELLVSIDTVQNTQHVHTPCKMNMIYCAQEGSQNTQTCVSMFELRHNLLHTGKRLKNASLGARSNLATTICFNGCPP